MSCKGMIEFWDGQEGSVRADTCDDPDHLNANYVFERTDFSGAPSAIAGMEVRFDVVLVGLKRRAVRVRPSSAAALFTAFRNLPMAPPVAVPVSGGTEHGRQDASAESPKSGVEPHDVGRLSGRSKVDAEGAERDWPAGVPIASWERE